MKRIIICSDGTWNKPEEDLKKDFPTNVLKFSRGFTPEDQAGNEQVVFYDLGIGSYYSGVMGGAFGSGLEKNVIDAYRFIIHNYQRGDELYFFGFSRGAYTVRSLCGLINNSGILRSEHGNRIVEAFELYKRKSAKPGGPRCTQFRSDYSHFDRHRVDFVGVWDTVGALGLPSSIFSFVKPSDSFYDRKIGQVIKTARHALAIDEWRKDFEATVWEPNEITDLKQVWFAGVHSDVGGSYKPDKDGTALADIPLIWLKEEAEKIGLKFDPYMDQINLNPLSKMNKSFKLPFSLMGKNFRDLTEAGEVIIHKSVKERYDSNRVQYKPKNLQEYIDKHGWGNLDD